MLRSVMSTNELAEELTSTGHGDSEVDIKLQVLLNAGVYPERVGGCAIQELAEIVLRVSRKTNIPRLTRTRMKMIKLTTAVRKPPLLERTV
jgi:hypothetical protein